MGWEKVTENDSRERTLHVGENRGPEAGEVTSIVAARGRVMAYDQEDHEAVFAGSDDGFVAMYDDNLNFEKDWKAQGHGVNCVAVGKDEKETVRVYIQLDLCKSLILKIWLYTCSAFGEIKQWWPAAVELIYQVNI